MLLPVSQIYSALVTLHGFAGAAGLLSLIPPLVSRKGGRLHRRAGWAFVVSLGVTAVTGLIIAGLWLTVPLQVKPPPESASPEQAAAWAGQLRNFALFLAYVGLLIGAGMWSGIRIVAVRRGRAPHGHPLDKAIAWGLLLGGFGLLVHGVALGAPLSLVFGALGIAGAWEDLRFLAKPMPTKMAWWYRHMESMSGAGIGALTAFAVFNLRWLGNFSPWAYYASWLAPAAIAIPALRFWIARYRRRFGEV